MVTTRLEHAHTPWNRSSLCRFSMPWSISPWRSRSYCRPDPSTSWGKLCHPYPGSNWRPCRTRCLGHSRRPCRSMSFCRRPDHGCSKRRSWHCRCRCSERIGSCSAPSAPEPSLLCLVTRELSISWFPQNSGCVDLLVHCHKCDVCIRDVLPWRLVWSRLNSEVSLFVEYGWNVRRRLFGPYRAMG